MARARKPLLVPISLHNRGGMLHDTDYARGAESPEHAAYIDAECLERCEHARWGADYYLGEVPAFTARLRTHDRGFSAGGYVTLVDEDGRQWPMFVADYVAMMTTANVTEGWIEPMKYETCKKGARAYGIRPVKS